MARIEKLIRKGFCDFCGKESDFESLSQLTLPATIMVTENFATHEEKIEKDTIATVDLCPTCNAKLKKAIERHFGKIQIKSYGVNIKPVKKSADKKDAVPTEFEKASVNAYHKGDIVYDKDGKKYKIINIAENDKYVDVLSLDDDNEGKITQFRSAKWLYRKRRCK